MRSCTYNCDTEQRLEHEITFKNKTEI